MTSAWFSGCNTTDEIRKRYHKLAMQYHPDRGGSNEVMAEINAAYDAACRMAGRSHAYQQPFSRRPEPESISTILRKVIYRLVEMDGLRVELCGTWIWVSGNTRAWHEVLKGMGLRWAPKKKMWYYAGTPATGRRNLSMDRIRSVYGSQTFTRDDVEV